MILSLLQHLNKLKFAAWNKQNQIIFRDERYADILQLIWPIINTFTNIYVYFFPTPIHKDHQVSSVVNLHTVLLCRLLLCRPASKCRHKIQNLHDVVFIPCAKRRKILELMLCKTCHIHF